MKQTITIALIGLLLLSFSSCSQEDISITDSLKISAYLFDKSVENPNDIKVDPYDFTLEQLKLNEVRLIAPLLGSMGMININIYFEFEGGLIEVISEDKDVQLSVGEKLEAWMQGEDRYKRTYGWNMSIVNKGYVAVIPLGSGYGDRDWRKEHEISINGYIGREYYLTVNAYSLSNDKAPVIVAKLKLVQLEDKNQIVIDDKTSHLFSIELVSYEYNNTYF